MNISEANAVSSVLSWITGRAGATDRVLADAEFLASRVNQALHAGITPGDVRANWPSAPPAQQKEVNP